LRTALVRQDRQEIEMTTLTDARAETAGASLYQTVQAYAAIGTHHRSGTPEGDATVAWFAHELTRLGARVSRQEYTFPRFDVRWQVRLDGDAVESLPYWYEGMGRIQTDRPVTGAVEVRQPPEMPPEYAPHQAAARAAGVRAAVVATRCVTGGLFAHNTTIRTPGEIALLGVPGRLEERLPDARIEVEFEAEIVEGRSANVIGLFGAGRPEDTVVLTTPLSGWFACAGERGTGIALLLEVAAALAGSAPLLVLGTTNHEIPGPGTGWKHFFETGTPRAKGVFHFGGSSVTVLPGERAGERGLNPGFGMRGWLGDARRAELEAAYAPLHRKVEIPSDAEHPTWPRWRGEALPRTRLGVPLISHGGRGPYTHTSQDLPELATTPAALAAVFACDLAAARLLAS